MAVFKCKMCGGSLEVTEGVTVCECEYCGTKQTLPKSGDDATSRLFNRANHLRMKCEFDKAQEIYEKIVSTQTDDAEAYWGLVLCKFGIEYVEDPGTFRKIPTCHRTQLDSILADMDYQSALKYADPARRNCTRQRQRKSTVCKRTFWTLYARKNLLMFSSAIRKQTKMESVLRTV